MKNHRGARIRLEFAAFARAIIGVEHDVPEPRVDVLAQHDARRRLTAARPPWRAPWRSDSAARHRPALAPAIAPRVRADWPATGRAASPSTKALCLNSCEHGNRGAVRAVAAPGSPDLRAQGPVSQRNLDVRNGVDPSVNLDELRSALTELDGELLALVAKRQALSEQVAAVKRATGRATRDFAREREVILRGRKTAQRLGLSPPCRVAAPATHPIVAGHAGASACRGAGPRNGQAGAGDRRPRQDGRVVRRISSPPRDSK